MTIKIITVGDSGVGKTSLLLSLLKSVQPDHPALKAHSVDEPDYESVPTIGVDQFDLRLPNGATVELWDTAGQERFMSLTSKYFRNADVVMVVCSASDRESVSSLRHRWIRVLRESTVGLPIQMILVCNKMDDPDRDEAVVADAEALAMQHGAAFVRASAKSDQVQDVGQRLVDIVGTQTTAAHHSTQNSREIRRRHHTAHTVHPATPSAAAARRDDSCCV